MLQACTHFNQSLCYYLSLLSGDDIVIITDMESLFLEYEELDEDNEWISDDGPEETTVEMFYTTTRGNKIYRFDEWDLYKFFDVNSFNRSSPGGLCEGMSNIKEGDDEITRKNKWEKYKNSIPSVKSHEDFGIL